MLRQLIASLTHLTEAKEITVPAPLIKKDVREGKGSKKSLEKKWKRAHDIAKKGDAEDEYALTTHIYKQMRDASVQPTGASILDKVQLNAAVRLLSVEQEES